MSTASDMKTVAQDMWESFKQKMREWVDESTRFSESEKSDMKDYIERLQMPEEENQ